MASTAGLTRYGLARLANVDDRYLARLASGVASNPSRDTVLALGMALFDYTSAFERADVDRALKIAGFPPSPERLWRETVYIERDDRRGWR